MVTSLENYNQTWSHILDSEGCPPVLGLVALSETDCQTVRFLVQDACRRFVVHHHIKPLIYLLQVFPAVMSVWLARKAGEAYELGTFWENFEEGIGVKIPSLERPNFAEHFRQSCRLVMAHYVTPPETGAFKHVEAFLFQAGLPLCHCDHFARLVRQVERRFGLPDPQSPEAGEELREHIMACFASLAVPLLKRSLRGPAGPLICQAALRVVFEADYQGINPRLGKALAAAFVNQSSSQLRRSARPPFLRLSDDFCSLEIVGPRQDSKLAGGGLDWVVGGRSHPTATFDEFVFPVEEQPRVTVELRGLGGGLTASRSFVVRLSDRDQPFMLFDGESRKLRREEIGRTLLLPSGDYCLLHPRQFKASPANDRYDWQDGERALSLLSIRPDIKVQLQDTRTGTWTFRAAQEPFVQPSGKCVISDQQEIIHFDWNDLPKVWRPHEGIPHRDEGWTAEVSVGAQRGSWELSGGEIEGGMICCQLEGKAFLRSLPSGLNRVQVSVYRQQRRESCQSFWLWVGLKAYRPGDEFELSQPPTNLVDEKCRGFVLGPAAIRHRFDSFRQHYLTFDVDEALRCFRWSQRGIFLESFEKGVGRIISPVSHRLGETFSASIDSPRWLRVWCIPAGNTTVRVNGQQIERMYADRNRAFFDLSLAHLSRAYPQGGQISLDSDGCPVATFARPLVANQIRRASRAGFQLLGFSFSEEVHWVRPRLCELATGRIVEFEEQAFDDGQCVFCKEGMPTLECIELCCKEDNLAQSRYTVDLSAPRDGWPPGFWLVELQVRHSPAMDWQLVTNPAGQRAPLLIAGPIHPEEQDLRLRLFLSAYSGRDAPQEFSVELRELAERFDELFDLLSHILEILRRPFAPEVRSDFRWVEDLFHAVGRQAGKRLSEATGHDPTRLLDLASVESELSATSSELIHTRSLFVTVPGLLALSAEHYCKSSTSHPLARSLQWCGRLAIHEFAFEAFRDLIEQVCVSPQLPAPDTFEVLQRFQNFAAVVQANGDAVEPTNFSHFDYNRYFGETIGALEGIQSQPDWDSPTALGRTHAEWALSQLHMRLQQTIEGPELGAVNALLNTAWSFRKWLKQSLEQHPIMPEGAWNQPWLRVSLHDQALIENCVRFASLFALAARTSGVGWLSFDDVMQWLFEHGNGTDKTEKTIATLVGLAPELLGFYLMFWELMIRSCPHG